MAVIQLQQFFRVDSDAIFDECDLLMEALVDSEDEHVYDAAVSADAERGVVIVEVVGAGVDSYDAEVRALERIRWALVDCVKVRVSNEVPNSRVVETLAAV